MGVFKGPVEENKIGEAARQILKRQARLEVAGFLNFVSCRPLERVFLFKRKLVQSNRRKIVSVILSIPALG